MSRVMETTDGPRAGAGPNISRSEEFEIDFDRLRKFGFITPGARRSRISEEFRLIKRRLMKRMTLNAKSRGPKRQRGREHVILVTSARPSEGKSFIAVNLALSIILDEGFNRHAGRCRCGAAQRSRTSSDCATICPVSPTCCSARSAGSREVLLRVNRDHPLSLMAAGAAPWPRPPISSAATICVSSWTGHFASRYTDRIIIFDAPPLLASTEPVALAEHAGQVVSGGGCRDGRLARRRSIRHWICLRPTRTSTWC